MGTYELKYEPVIINSNEISKWNIYYYDENGNLELKENYSCDGVVIDTDIRKGYILCN